MDKIDTQGMSGPATPGGSDNIYPHDENGEPILPRAVILLIDSILQRWSKS